MDDFFKRTPNFDEKEASVTGKTEEEKQYIYKTSDDDDANAEDDERIHIDKEKVVTIEEEKKTLEYQETMNLDIENIASSSQQIWISIYEVIDDTYLKYI